MARVLVVDDELAMRELLRLGLRKSGHAVEVAAGADEGLRLVRAGRHDAVLLDLEMPTRDGLEFLLELRADPATAKTPVLMVTANPVRDTILRVAQLGVQGVVLKGEGVLAEVTRRLAGVLSPSAGAPPAGAACAQKPPPRGPETPPAPAAPAPAPSAGVGTTSAAVKADAERAGAQRDEDDAESLRASLLNLDAGGADLERATAELKKLRPLMTRSELLERVVEGSELRAVRPAVQRVLGLTGSAGASLDGVAKAIRQDQALSLKILKVANSPLYARGDRVETVQRAVARIGVAQVRQTVLSLSVVERFGTVTLADRLRADWFWEHSIGVGLLASRITRLRGGSPEEADAMFTAGLLHDVGRVLMAERLGETYTGVIDVADRLELPLETVESRLLLVNHADLTDRLLRSWNFSPELINPIALHHLSVGNARRTAPRTAEEVVTLGLANALAHALLLGSSGNEAVYPIEEHARFLGLGPGNVAELAASVPDQVLDLRLAMLTDAPCDAPSALDGARSKIAPPLRPLYVAAEPGLCAVRMLLERMAGAEGADGARNLAVVRVTDARERGALMGRLKAAEEEAGVDGLPTLVVGNGTGCLYAEGMLGRRPLRQLTSPVRLSRLLRAVNELAGREAPVAAAA